MKRFLVTALCFTFALNIMADTDLTLDDIFPNDRVLDVQITIDEKDWDKIRYQSRNFLSALDADRKLKPPKRPYTYVTASVTIDGVTFPKVGLRKKGFLGSLSHIRPSLKIKLNHIDKNGQIDGLTNLTLNNNQQDESLVSQFMGYAIFNAAASPAPRCAYAKVTVNGTDLGIYSHVETMRKPILKRSFGNDNGTLYEGPYVDFYRGWENSFDRKQGKKKRGKKKIKQLIEVLESDDENIDQAIAELIDLDSFYTYWAVEGLLGFWDSYSGNKNNFFIYLNPETDKFHFLPWGADSLFRKYSMLKHDPNAPISVKMQGLIAHKLYQIESCRDRYLKTLNGIIEKHWNEDQLLAETDRIEAMIKPHLVKSQKGKFVKSLKETRKFIRQRRAEIAEETADGMPIWTAKPDEIFVIKKFEPKENSIWSAATTGDLKAIEEFVAKDRDLNDRDREHGVTLLSWATLYDQIEIVELLIENGADVNVKNRDRGTALHGSAFLGKIAIAKLLIENGADVNAKNEDGETPLDNSAVDWGTTEFIAGRLQMKLDREKVESGRTVIADLLRQNGAKAGKPKDDIWSAAFTGNLRAVIQHLKKGVDVNAKDPVFGSTPLHTAAIVGQNEVAELLIKKGADVNAKSKDGGTPLHNAAFLGRSEVAKLLIENGADPNAENIRGETPMDSLGADWQTTKFIAGLLKIEIDQETVEKGRSEIADLLRENGAK